MDFPLIDLMDQHACYAKLLAPSLNIFTDPRLIASLMPDIAKARAMHAATATA